jgi:hypothetical protein
LVEQPRSLNVRPVDRGQYLDPALSEQLDQGIGSSNRSALFLDLQEQALAGAHEMT